MRYQYSIYKVDENYPNGHMTHQHRGQIDSSSGDTFDALAIAAVNRHLNSIAARGQKQLFVHFEALDMPVRTVLVPVRRIDTPKFEAGFAESE